MTTFTVGLVISPDFLFTSDGGLSPWVPLTLASSLVLAIGLERIYPIINGLFLGSGVIYNASVAAARRVIFTRLFLEALIYWVSFLIFNTQDLITHVQQFLDIEVIDLVKARLILNFLTEFLKTHDFIFMVLNRLGIILELSNWTHAQELVDLITELRETGNLLYSLYRKLEEVLGVAIGDSALPLQDWEM